MRESCQRYRSTGSQCVFGFANCEEHGKIRNLNPNHSKKVDKFAHTFLLILCDLQTEYLYISMTVFIVCENIEHRTDI